ncbi:MAG: glycoside hydrolase domain-containing protein [Longimicrobiales bacterium]
MMMTRTRAMVVAMLAASSAAACAGGGLPAPGVAGPAGVPGFDTREYPGEDAMRAWADASPYEWVGFYLPAPCYTGTSWIGQRDALRASGWGLAVLFVGEQDWSGEAEAPTPGLGQRCTRSNLTAAQGREDAMEAGRTAALEGFPTGTAIFLDVERVASVSDPLAAYVRGWVRGLLEGGTYVPALYAHAENADALYALVLAAYEEAGAAGQPPLWVATSRGFQRGAAPTLSGFPNAAIWQGAFDVRESWGGVELTIDVNVATSAEPSGG